MNTKTIEQFSTMTADMLAGVEGGWGYRWRCTDVMVIQVHGIY
ncbi:bacteriocin [Streptococcus equi subsp. zooepidemicus Sz16]|nr:ComC/BlpC family leader-containing pheromone/bacteriocin [Streptococcus equi]KIS08005.1 bacteriocin [Streptococcus equi subsp. zooepidemicus Sz16]QUQ78019.1 hypothetical protein JDBNIEOD_01048 [Streptococcus equi subsp. zooepidemicus]SQF05567.1 bacteriocin [Streptococcus equi subsp. zooepidemicus]